MAEAKIEPGTDALFRVRLKVNGILRDDATVTASVYSPRGVEVATNQAMIPVGPIGLEASGLYSLAIQPNWSIVSGKYIEGEFLVRVKAIRGSTRVRDFRYNCQFDAMD